MTLNGSHLEIPYYRRADHYGEQRLDQLQVDLVYVARMRARDEVGAAIAHELNEPLTALLLYLHAIERASEGPAGLTGALTPMRVIVEKALQEVERACGMMERMRHTVEKPIEAESAVKRGREAIGAWAHGHSQSGSGAGPLSPSLPRQYILTPREREVLAQITSGASNKEGGRQLGISTRTFEVHRAHIMDKLGAKNGNCSPPPVSGPVACRRGGRF
jgi:DNA-binding CsgD family transcriptional regulator